MMPHTISLIINGTIKMRNWEEYRREKYRKPKRKNPSKKDQWIRQLLSNSPIE